MPSSSLDRTFSERNTVDAHLFSSALDKALPQTNGSWRVFILLRVDAERALDLDSKSGREKLKEQGWQFGVLFILLGDILDERDDVALAPVVYPSLPNVIVEQEYSDGSIQTMEP